jgi:hypothetical protein
MNREKGYYSNRAKYSQVNMLPLFDPKMKSWAVLGKKDGKLYCRGYWGNQN